MHYNGANSFLFVNGKEIYKFKAKDPEIVEAPFMPRKHFERLSVDNMKKTGFNGYVYYFSVDYDAMEVDDLLEIHKF